MRTETITLYFAEDGTPFNQDKEACEYYENFCIKIKTWLQKGLIRFWDGSETYLNSKLINYTFTNNLCYSDWLKKRLSYCYFIIISSQPGEELWEDLWEFVSKYCPMSESERIKISRDYKKDDLIAYDVYDCKFHNFSLVARNTETIYDRLLQSFTDCIVAAEDE